MTYGEALALTVAVEVPLYVAVLRAWRPPAGSVRRCVLVALVANLLSHPVAMLVVVPTLRHALSPTASLAVAEIAVLVGEAALVWWRLRQPVAAAVSSAVANLASLSVGFLLAG